MTAAVPQLPPLSGLVPTVWSSDGCRVAWRAARPLVLSLRPAAVQLHTWPGPESQRVAEDLRRELPGVRILVGVGVDSVARTVALGRSPVTDGARRLARLATEALEYVHADAIVWNAEAGWKATAGSEEDQRLEALVRETLARVASEHPTLPQVHTSYDHPSYHATYPWRAWLGPDSPVCASLPQVYAAPAGGLMAHRGALPAREARALASWGAAIRASWVRPDAPAGTPEDARDVDRLPYYQLHHVTAADTITSALAFPVVFGWALPTRYDTEGLAAAEALSHLARLGLWRPDGVRVAQQRARDAGLDVGPIDGIPGPRTRAALGRL